MAESLLVTGGSRSGKSSFALRRADAAKRPFFIATGWAGDAEMAERIRKHKAERDARWSVIETRDDLPAALAEAEAKGADFIIIDCLTLWTSNIVCCAPETFDAKLAALLEAVKATKPPLALVTNEVGLGIVPGDPLSRAFRDAAGTVNRKVAEIVDAVYLTVCGIPLKIK